MDTVAPALPRIYQEAGGRGTEGGRETRSTSGVLRVLCSMSVKAGSDVGVSTKGKHFTQ